MSQSRFALGLLELRGYVVTLAAADAMAKVAPVVLSGPAFAGDGLVTLAVHGEIAAVREALSVGSAVATRLGGFVAATTIGRPEAGLGETFGLANGEAGESERETGQDQE